MMYSMVKMLLNSLKDGMKTLPDVRKIIEVPHSGTSTSLIEHFAGFVQKQNLLERMQARIASFVGSTWKDPDFRDRSF